MPNDHFTNKFGQLVRDKRRNLGWTQEQLALKIWNDSTRKSKVSQIENGHVSNPQEKTVAYFCDALSIGDDELLKCRVAPRDSEAVLEHVQDIEISGWIEATSDNLIELMSAVTEILIEIDEQRLESRVMHRYDQVAYSRLKEFQSYVSATHASFTKYAEQGKLRSAYERLRVMRVYAVRLELGIEHQERITRIACMCHPPSCYMESAKLSAMKKIEGLLKKTLKKLDLRPI